MKRLLLLAAVFACSVVTASAQGDGSVNSEIFWDGGTIPGSAFREFVLANFDTDHDGRISKAEADAVTEIDPSGNCNSGEIKGIEYFTNLKIFRAVDMPNLKLSYLSKNKKLTSLEIGANVIYESSIDLSQFTELTNLAIVCTELISLDLSANTALKKLDCSWNLDLTSLVLPKGAQLTYLDCNGCALTTLDVSGLPALTKLICHDNKLTSLDLSENTVLEWLNCHSNRIALLDLSANRMLTGLGCSNNPLQRLNLSNLSRLEDVSMPAYDPNGGLVVVVNNTTKTVSGLAEYLAAQEKQRLQAERLRLEIEAREAAKIQAQKHAAENKRQVAAYISSNDWVNADRCAAEALSDMPCGDAYLYFVRAKAYYLRNLDFKSDEDEDVTAYFNAYRQEAQHTVELCNKSIRLDASGSNEAYFIRGLAYVVLKMPDNATADFKRFMSGAPAHKGPCYYNIGIAYKNAQQWRNALDNFKLARQHYTDKKDVEKCLKKIKACQEKIDGK